MDADALPRLWDPSQTALLRGKALKRRAFRLFVLELVQPGFRKPTNPHVIPVNVGSFCGDIGRGFNAIDG